MFDGTYIYPSNPIFVCNYTDWYYDDEYNGSIVLIVVGKMVKYANDANPDEVYK